MDKWPNALGSNNRRSFNLIMSGIVSCAKGMWRPLEAGFQCEIISNFYSGSWLVRYFNIS